MKRSDKDYKVEEWNGHDIYVDGSGTFFVHGETFATPRAAEATSIDALKRALSVGRDVEIQGVMMPRRSYNDNEDLRVVTVVKITGLGNLMYREQKAGPKGPVHKASQGERIYIYDDERAVERARLIRVRKDAEKALKALMDKWPVIAKDSAP